MTFFILFCMVFMHICDDYYLQGILAKMKQKSWWVVNCPNPEDAPGMFDSDYKAALAIHSFSWAFMTMLPIAVYSLVTAGTIPGLFFFMFIVNAAIHYSIDDMKANWGSINLCTDQKAHILQIVCTWMICMY